MKKNNSLFFHFCLYILKLKLYLHPLNGFGALAQLVEQWTENPCVPGSIPGGTTLKTRTEMFGFFCFKLLIYFILHSNFIARYYIKETLNIDTIYND